MYSTVQFSEFWTATPDKSKRRVFLPLVPAIPRNGLLGIIGNPYLPDNVGMF